MRHLLTTVVCLMAASPVHAQRSAYEAEREMERLLEDARSYYENLELDRAEDALERAVRTGREFDVKSPVFAEIYIQRGILLYVRDKEANADAAVQDFTRALEIDDRARLDPLVSTPSLERLFEDARRDARPPRRDRRDDRRDTRRDDRRDRRDDGRDRFQDRPRDPVIHKPPAFAKGGEKLPIRIDVDPSINRQVYRVNLFFRSARADSPQRLEMRPEGRQSFVATIPGRFVAGRTLTYYVKAEDREGKVVGAVKNARDPVTVEIKGGAFAGLDEIPSGGSLSGGGDDDGTDRELVSFAISLGSGGGFISEFATPQRQTKADIRPGFALAPFHTLVELDFWPAEWFGLGAYGRIQVVESAYIVGGRLKFKVAEEGPHRLVLRAGGGYGRVRHLVDLGTVLDTTLEGPYHYTLGASYIYAFNKTFGLAITPDFLHLIGDSPSLHIDLQAGIRMGF